MISISRVNNFVGAIVLVFGAILIRTYLRALDYFHTHETKTKNSILPWCSHVLEHILICGQKLLVYRAMYWYIFSVHSENSSMFPVFITIVIIIIPRIIFSIFLLAPKYDYNRSREKNIKRKINIAAKIATKFHKVIVSIFSVLNVQENTIVTFLERIEYVTLQLLGQDYSEYTIKIYMEIESGLVCCSIIYLYIQSQAVNLYLYSILIIYPIRFLTNCF